jgi:hypothetical protein
VGAGSVGAWEPRLALSPRSRLRLPSRGRSAASSMLSDAASTSGDDGDGGDDAHGSLLAFPAQPGSRGASTGGGGGGGAGAAAEAEAELGESTVVPAHAKLTIRHELDEIDSLLCALRQPPPEQWAEEPRAVQATHDALFRGRGRT